MHYLIYVSSASHLLDDAELKGILDASRTNNAMNDVTGMLLYKDGSFMQVLEGEPEIVAKTFDRISEDRRHNGIITLCEEEADNRIFQGWSMGFQTLNPDDLKDVPEFADFKNGRFTDPSIVENPHVAVRLLRTFYQ
ncbi:BLUF domain-containing protein [uncultured Sneathiella sp.]|uniref:BLUF domain-containing protein n=1 Tax=uncultured Sneathiella sp. TaxID=879315 RepID=UPI0030EC8961|tara:strand:- start:41184 stop:41594 length:411 start_codon:yes stop_codon:yes gene_type:complete